MDSQPAQTQDQPQAQPQQEPKKKVLRNRRFSKEVIKENSAELILKVKHTPYKGEKLADTVRKDNKYNPNQRFYAGRPL